MAAAAILSICGTSAASGQATNAVDAALDGVTSLQCIQISRDLARVTVGRTRGTKLRLSIGRATGCDIAETNGAWTLHIDRLDAKGGVVGTEADYVRPDSCPALSAYANRLSAPRLTNQHWWAEPVAGVTVGPFFIENPAGILQIGSEHGRHATEKWLRGMLAAVRNCWSNPDSDGDLTHPLTDRFYAAIGL
jgi:hypothetical protein